MLRKIISSIKHQASGIRFLLSIISAILLILAYPGFNLEFLAWIALIPLFFALENKNLKQRFITGYIFGIIFYSGILYWLANVTIPGTIVLIFLLSFAPAIFCSLYLKLIPPSAGSRRISSGETSYGKTYNLLLLFAVPAAWVITEYLTTHLFTGFPWAFLGYTQYLNLPIIQISDITGACGVSFVIVFVNYCIYKVFRSPEKKIYAVCGISAVILCCFYGFYRLNQNYITRPLKIAVIQGNIPQELKWDENYEKFILDKYELLTLEAVKDNPALIIWPETSVPGLLEEEYIFDRIMNLVKSIDIDLLVGTVRRIDSKFYNSATLISKKGEILDSYDKIHLVPLGEYIPFEKYAPWFRNIIDKPIGDFEFGREFKLLKIKTEQTSTSDRSIVKDIYFYKFGVLICFEDIFPNLAREFVKKGALFLVNMTNDAWFGKTSAPYQHLQSSVFRAVENRVPVVRSTNTGISCFINQKGEIKGSVRRDGKEIFIDGLEQSEIYSIKRSTIYTRFADWFSYLCFAIFIISLLKRLPTL